MKYEYLNCGGTDLAVLFGGWAFSPAMVSGLDTGRFSLLSLYDCAEVSEEEVAGIREIAASYGSLSLLAWSFGVFHASRLKSTLFKGMEFERSVAVNGTLTPVDDLYGIPDAIFRGTLDHLDERNLHKFFIRVFGGARAFSATGLTASDYDMDFLKRELEAVFSLQSGHVPDASEWDFAVVGGRDMIFPPENMYRAWEASGVRTVSFEDMPHYPFGVCGSLEGIFAL